MAIQRRDVADTEIARAAKNTSGTCCYVHRPPVLWQCRVGISPTRRFPERQRILPERAVMFTGLLFYGNVEKGCRRHGNFHSGKEYFRNVLLCSQTSCSMAKQSRDVADTDICRAAKNTSGTLDSMYI